MMYKNIDERCFKEFITIETNRLTLRKMVLGDVEDILKVYGDPKVAQYDWFEPFETIEMATKLINHVSKEFEDGEEITWGVVRKEDEAFIGYCCLGDFDDEARRSEIGYGIRSDEWNKGYGTEVVKALSRFGFEEMNLNRIEAFITPDNGGSIKVLEKVGFVQEGVVRERDFIKGKLEDGVVMAMLKSDYDKM